MKKNKFSLSKFILMASITTILTGSVTNDFIGDSVYASPVKSAHQSNTNKLKKAKKSKNYDSTTVVEATASSSKENKHIMHTLDSSMKTAWEDDSPGNGVGETLSYKFDSLTNIGRVLITNGDVSSKENYYNKNRIAKADLKYYNGDKLVLVQQVDFADNYTKKPYHVELDKKVDVDKVEIEVTAIHQGKNKDTLAISEVTFGNLEKDKFQNKFNQLREKWVTDQQAEEFIKYAEAYADKAIAMSAVSSRTEYYRMYESRKYNYKKEFVENLKKIYLDTGASHIASKKDIISAFENAARGFSIGRQEHGLFVTSVAEDNAHLYDDKGNLKAAAAIEEIKGVDPSKYKDGVYQYEYDAALAKNINQLGFIRTASGDTPGANSLNIPGCQTFAGKNIQNSESELIFPSIDVKGISSKKVLAEIDSKGYFEIVDPTIITPKGERKQVSGRFKIKKM
ncbi:NADase-type glycan-binding domain-containing protein [Streptococcus canis]|uniref:NADase-type glycan-binding domain-containing protein n=1 Tax=Streptococcus canis TaxID=1329 RepID=UPI004036A16F